MHTNREETPGPGQNSHPPTAAAGNGSEPVWRRWMRNLGIIALLYVVGTAIAFFWAVHRAHVHRQWEQQVEILILQFARKRPPDVPSETWAKCLQWTLMLHGEYGGLSYFPSAAREPLIHDLERHLAEPV